jgi:hypothetical protein
MSEIIGLDSTGGQLRAIRAEQRTVRAEYEIVRTAPLRASDVVVPGAGCNRMSVTGGKPVPVEVDP